jgi:osmoprotectant transport system permease protein
MLGFDDAYALAMTKARAAEWRVETIADLARHAKHSLKRPLKVAGDIMFFERKEWAELKKAYGLSDKNVDIVAMDQTRMYGAAVDEQVDVIVGYTSDGRVKAYDLLLLDDPLRVFPPYDAILVASPHAAERPGFLQALEPLLGAIDQKTIMEANRRVDVEGQSPAAAARWLLAHLQRNKK